MKKLLVQCIETFIGNHNAKKEISAIINRAQKSFY